MGWGGVGWGGVGGGGGGGGGGGRGPTARKQSVFFLVLNLFYSLQRGSNDFITEGGPAFSKRGVKLLPGGGGGGGGPNANFYRKPYNL